MVSESEEEMQKILKGVRTIGPYNPGVQEAAHTIAEAMMEGVVYEDVFRAEEYEDYMLLLSKKGTAQLRTTANGLVDGEEYRVTVRRGARDGEGD